MICFFHFKFFFKYLIKIQRFLKRNKQQIFFSFKNNSSTQIKDSLGLKENFPYNDNGLSGKNDKEMTFKLATYIT